MTWEATGEGGVRLYFGCDPNQRVVIESPDLLAQLRASKRTRASVEFEVRRGRFGGGTLIDVVSVNGERDGSWRTAEVYAESSGMGREVDPYVLCE